MIVTKLANGQERLSTSLNRALNLISIVSIIVLLLIAYYNVGKIFIKSPEEKQASLSTLQLDPRTKREVITEEKTRAAYAQEQALAESKLNQRIASMYPSLKPPADTALVMEKAARTYGIDDKLLLSICVVESSLRSDVKSSAGAVGMCQVIPRWHGVTKKDMMNYRLNIDKSAAHIAELSQKCKGQRSCVVHSYNVGYSGYLKGDRARTYLARVNREYSRSTPL